MDTSGNITSTGVDAAKQAILLHLHANSLRGYIKVALMSFSTPRYLDVCFDCYLDKGPLRQAICAAIMNPRYIGGSALTADAIKCACEKMWTPSCDLRLMTNNIDVVILTDGLNNNAWPCRNKDLAVVKCPKDEHTINIFTIAISSGSAQTVANLVKHPYFNQIFEVKDFAELKLLAGAAEAAAAGGTCFVHSGGLCK